MKRIAASYIYTLENTEPVVDGFVEIEDDGTVIRTGKCEDISSEPVFYRGAVAPGFVNCHCPISRGNSIRVRVWPASSIR